MRLLFVSHSFPPEDRPLTNVGGMQRVASELHEALQRDRSISCDHLLLRSSWRSIHLRTGPFLVKAYRGIRRRARHGEVDVVLFSSMVTASLAVPLQSCLRRHGVRTAAIVHGLDVTTPFKPYQWFIRRVFSALDLVLPVSAATGAACENRGLPYDKIRVVRNGVDLDRFRPLKSTQSMRRRLIQTLDDRETPLPEDALLLCSVGRQVRRKGFAWFIEEVMPELPETVYYWLAGDGPQTPQIRQAILAAGLSHRVRLLGRIPESDLQRLYRGADLFIMPNISVPGDMEGFGVVMLEAGMSGLPTVGARLEGIAEVISDGHNGHLVPSGDAVAFAAAIGTYVGNPDRVRRAAHRAFDYTRRHFSWRAVAADYARVLRDLIETNGDRDLQQPAASPAER